LGTLLDYSFPGGDANPNGSPLATPSGYGTFQRISNQGGVSAGSTFSLAHHDSSSATPNHKSTAFMGAVGGGTGGPAVCMNVLTGACYFTQSGNLTDMTVYYHNGVGGFSVLTTIGGETYNTTDGAGLERIDAIDTLRVYRGATQIGSDIVDASLTGGEPGVTGYDATQRYSRLLFEDDSAGPTGGGGPLIGGLTRSTLTQGRLVA
jgi:hypothetical protein